MTVIDSQVHAYGANTPDRAWHSEPNWPAHVTGDEMVAAMDAVGVDGAILVSAFSIYQYDASYAVEVRNAHPGRFSLVKPIDPEDPAHDSPCFTLDQRASRRSRATNRVSDTAAFPPINRSPITLSNVVPKARFT